MVICFSAVSPHTGHLHAWFVTHKILKTGVLDNFFKSDSYLSLSSSTYVGSGVQHITWNEIASLKTLDQDWHHLLIMTRARCLSEKKVSRAWR